MDNAYNSIDGNLNAQRYRDEVLRPIVRPIFLMASVTNRCISLFPVMKSIDYSLMNSFKLTDFLI